MSIFFEKNYESEKWLIKQWTWIQIKSILKGYIYDL